MIRDTRSPLIFVPAAAALLVLAGCGEPVKVDTATAPPPAAAAAPAEPALPVVDMTAAQARAGSDLTVSAAEFPRTGRTELKGEVKGYAAPAYAVPLGAGQTLTVVFAPSNDNLYFNVIDLADTTGEAAFRGEVSGRTATITVTKDATFLITPFQPRATARRDETGSFTLTLERK